MDKTKRKGGQIYISLSFCFKLWKRCPTLIVVELVIKLIRQAQRVLMAVFFLRLIVDTLEQRKLYGEVIQLFCFFALFYLVYVCVTQLYEERYKPVSDLKIRTQINLLLFEKAEQADLSCYETPEYYDQYTRALMEAEGRVEGLLDHITTLIASFTAFLIIGISIWKMDPAAELFSIFPLISTLVIGKSISGLLHELNQKNTSGNRQKDYMKRVMIMPDYAKEIRITGIYNVLSRDFECAVNQLIKNRKEVGLKIALLAFVWNLCNSVIPYLGVWFYCAYRIFISGTLTIGQYTVIGVAVTNLAWQTMELVQTVQNIFDDFLFLKNLQGFISTRPAIDNGDGMVVPTHVRKEIEFRDVSFRYPGSSNLVFSELNLKIKEGTKVAIVGMNGAGKSTLLKLLLRLYDPEQGVITLDGIDIRKYQTKEYRDLFSVFFQDFQILSATVWDNVFMGNKHGSCEECKSSLEKGMIWDKVRSYPQKEETVLLREFDEQGVLLSGGESSKIALARMFAKDGAVMILDEPSASLDPIAEERLFHHILSQFRNRTMVFVTHRLTAASVADHIIVIEDGQVREQGTHKVLMEQKGRYYDMFTKQKEAYLEGEK